MMTDAEVRAALNNRQAFSLTDYGEARGEPEIGRVAVAHVIDNRVKAGKWGPTHKAVCLWPAQFSCWQPVGGAMNYAVVMAMARDFLGDRPVALPASLQRCVEIADAVIAGKSADPTGGACFYLTHTLYATDPPKWALAMTMTVQIGEHVFLAERA